MILRNNSLYGHRATHLCFPDSREPSCEIVEDFPETALITPFSPSSTSSSQFWTEATGRPVLTAVDLKQSTLDFCFNIDYSFPEHLLITGEFSTDVEIGLAHCRLQLHSGCTQLVFRDVSLSIARAHCSYCPTSRLTNLDKSASESRRDSRYLRHNMTTLQRCELVLYDDYHKTLLQ